MLDDLLRFDQAHGMFHASAMAFGVTPKQSIVARSRHYVGAMRHGRELRDDIIQPAKFNRAGQEPFRKITNTGGRKNCGLINIRLTIPLTWCFMVWGILIVLTGWCSSIAVASG